MIDSAWLEILCCPETRQALREVEPGRLQEVNAQVAEGKVKNRSGQLVSLPVDGLLIREDGKVGYPIRDGIPVMLISEALVLV